MNPRSLLITLSIILLPILSVSAAVPSNWAAGIYAVGDLVIHDSTTYIATQTVSANEGNPTTATAYWSSLDSQAAEKDPPPDEPGSPPPLDGLTDLKIPDSNGTSGTGGTDTGVTPSGHPSASLAAFVSQQYLDFLEREPEADGLNAWVDILENGYDSDGDGVKDPFTRADLVNIKVSSAEFDNKIAPIVRLYFAYLGRRPEQQGFADWIKYKIGKGPGEWAGREMTIEEMSQFFADAQEFIDKYGSLTNSEFVALLYQNVQGREGSAEEISAWVDILENGHNGETWNRGRVMVGFSESGEYKTKMDPEVRVYSLYWGLLNRVPDPVGWDGNDGEGGEKGWPDYIKEGWSPNALINGFLDSEEYLNRFDTASPYAEK